jgi:AcrR family transcriptional regulator
MARAKAAAVAEKAPERRSARDRLLAAADELFYEEGFNTVGIDRVIERAGVAKASLYDVFGSKEELIRSYLEAKQEQRRALVEQKLAAYSSPRARLLGMFDLMAELSAQPGFRGCAFAKAGVEAKPGTSVMGVCEHSRAWMRGLFERLAREAGAREPEELARQLLLLYDGASMSAHIDHDAAAALSARQMAALLLDAATGKPAA